MSLPRLRQPDLDPARHWLTRPRLEETPDGTGRFVPITLDEAAGNARDQLETGADDTGRPLNAAGIVVIPPGRAAAIAGLLDDLAKRLKPGTQVGPIQSNGDYSKVARELADYLHHLANP